MGNILIVDDDKITGRAFSQQLKKRGYSTVYTSSGMDALDHIRSERPDMVLLDHLMPDMNGLDTYREIRKIDPRLPVIMITAHGSLPLSVEFMKLGGRDFMEKPFDFDILDIKIKQAFKSLSLEEKMREMEIERKAQVEIEKIKNTIIAFISHDLLAPLEEISNNIDGALRQIEVYRGDAGPFIEKLEMISRISCELNLIVNDLLETALIRKGVHLQMEPVDFSHVIGEVRDELTVHPDAAVEPSLEIRWRIVEPLPCVHADRLKLKKVILNLVKNAFTTRKPIVIEAWPEEKGVVLSVCSENMAFFKNLSELGLEPREKKEKGYSSFRFWIGFSIAQKLAELMGCHICLEKYLSQGSLVYLLIPSSEEK